MFRRKHGSDTWHWCKNCSRYPNDNYEQSETKPNNGELCNECKSKTKDGDCD